MKTNANMGTGDPPPMSYFDILQNRLKDDKYVPIATETFGVLITTLGLAGFAETLPDWFRGKVTWNQFRSIIGGSDGPSFYAIMTIVGLKRALTGPAIVAGSYHLARVWEII